MRNFTFRELKFFKLISFILLFLLAGNFDASAQFFKKHYIAPAPWQYTSNANEIVIATNSTSTVTFTITRSNGTAVSLTKNGTTVSGSLTTIKGAPAVYRFVGDPTLAALGYNALNTPYADRGLIVTVTSTTGEVSVNLRNVASDAVGGDTNIKGNASLTSFGDAGIGTEFRVGYYRNATSSTATDRPIYSVMAINGGTQVKLNGALLTTLAAGQSYLFNANIGDLVESSGGSIVMNTGMRVDTPGGCGDGTFDQLPPVSVLGMEYFLERGKGNDTAEQTTVVATKPGTVLTINTYAVNGTEIAGSPVTINLANAGSFHILKNGVSGTQFTSSRILATNNVAVYSGTGDNCEVDISTIAPVSACGGSNFVETSSFLGYGNQSLDYFGYVLLKSATDAVTVNAATPINLSPRRKLGTTDWYIIDFNRTQIGNPGIISLSSASKLTVSIAQQGSGYSMAAFFSNFAQQPTAPKETYIQGNNCLKESATLTTDPGFAPYEWRYNGVVIPNQTSNTITVTKTGSYTVVSTLSCGVSSQSTPIAVTLCSDVAVENKIDVASQCVGSNVVFTITAKNLGPANAESVSVTDQLPSGYTYVSSVASAGTSYNNTNGIWTISNLDNGASAVLTITATVNSSGNYNNTATISSSYTTDNPANNTASASVTRINPPTTADAGPDQTGSATCGLTTISLAGNTPTNGTGKWTIVSGTGGSFASDTNPKTTFSGVAGASYTLRWTISNDPCVASTDDVVVTFNQLPTAAVNATVATGVTCTGFTANWQAVADATAYLLDISTTRTFNGGTFVATYNGRPVGNVTSFDVTGLNYGTTYFYRVWAVNQCGIRNEVSNEIEVFVNGPVTTGGTICQGGSGILSSATVCSPVPQVPRTASGSGGTSNSVNYGGNGNTDININFPTLPSGAVVTSTATTISFKTNGSSWLSDLRVRITPPSAFATQTGDLKPSEIDDKGTETKPLRTWNGSGDPKGNWKFEFKESFNDNGVNPDTDITNITITVNYTLPGSIEWYKTATSTTPLGTGSTFDPVVSDGLNTNIPGKYTYYSVCTGGSCRTATDFIINPAPAAATLSSNSPVCSGSNAVFTITGTAGNTVTYTGASSGTATIGSGGTVDITVSNVSSNTTLNIINISNGTCNRALSGAAATATVTVNPTPAPPTASALVYCSSENKTINDLTVTTGSNLKWYTTATGGTALAASTVVTTNTYYVSESSAAGCESTRTSVSVTVNPTPAPPTASALVYCSSENKTINDLTVTTGSNLKWYTTATGGTALAASTVVTTNTYYVSQSSAAGCESTRTSVSVTVNPTPAPPTASALVYCSSENKTINDLTVTTGSNLKWYTTATGGTALAASTVVTTNTYYVSESSAAGCESTRTSVSVTVNPTPAPPTASALVYCSSENKTINDLTVTTGSNLKWYTTATGGTALAASTVVTANTYYVSQSSATGCESARTTVSVTEQAQPNAGTNGTLTICSGSTVTSGSLFAALGGSPDAGGTWSPAFAGAGTYTYTVAATAPCTVDAVSTVSVTEQAQPDAGTNGTLTICSGSTVTSGSLFAALGGSPDAGGTWSPAFAGAGTYTYTVAATAPCTVDAVSTVSVTEQAQPDAGTNGTLTICSGSTVTSGSLFAALGGSPDAGGTWTPAFAGAGTYTYTVAATAPCTVDAVSTVSVTEQAQPNAGTNGTLTICSGSTVTAAALFAQLGGSADAGGTWSPAFAGAGTYTYTVAATAPCTVDAVSTVSVTEQAQPNAGTNGTLTICSGSTVTAAALFAQLGGSADAGGTWSPAFAGAGTYTYTVAATAPCTVDAVSTVSVTEQAQPDAGTNGTLTICSGSTVTSGSLFAALGGSPDAGGTWSPAFAGAGTYTYTVAATAPCTVDAVSTVSVTEQAQPDAGTNGTLTICSGSTVTSGSLFAALGGSPDAGGTWSPAFAGAGTYTYTVAATAPCTVDAVSTVSVTEQAQPDAGTNGTLTICSGSTVTSGSLFAALGGSPDAGGTWSPAFAGAGTYTYTVAATAPCTVDAVSTVSVTEQAQPDAGTNGTLTICSGSTVTSGSLFAALGGSPDAGGTWSPAFAGAGTYTYTVAATAPCTVDAVSTVSVTEQAQPDAGTNGTLTICSGSTVTSGSLFAALGGSPDAGGTWSPAFAGAGTYTYTVAATAPCTVDAVSTVSVTEQAQPDAGTNGTLTICSGSTVTSGSLFAALGGSPDAGGTWSPAFAGAGTYTYTVAATAPCTVDAVSTVSVTEQAQPDAGTNGTLTICSGSTVTSGSLFAALGGSPDAGGTWTPAFAGAGTYTYTVAATAPCTVDAVSTVSVTEQAQPNAGTNGTLTICSGSTVTAAALFAQLGGSADAGGTWSPAFAGAGTYTYTVAATAPCTVDAVSTVSVTEQAQPNAGTNGTLTICSGSTVTAAALFAQLGGSADAGGTWSPAFAGAGTYTYTVAATAPCTVDAVSTVSVTEQAQPDAGTNGTLTICSGSTVTSGSLFAALGGSPDAGGTWSPAFAGAGTYTYTVAATAPCTVDAVSTVSVTEQAQPDAGTNGTLTICSGSTVTSGSLFAALGGSPDAGGTWSPAFAGAGTYTYTVAATAPCTVDAVSTVSVTEQAQPDAGTNGTLTICSGSTVTSGSLFAALGGSPDAGGTWSPAFAGAGTYTYTYTVAATAPCTVDAVSTVSVTEQAQPDAGTNGTLTICSGSTVTSGSLFAALGGSPDAGGTWSPAFAGAGTYTYTVAATAPCTVDAVSTVSVTEQAQPDAGTNGTLTICSGSTVTSGSLFAALGGSPDAGGTWSPAFAGAGTYTYTVAATAPCTVDAVSTVSVTEQAQPDAGTNGTLTICSGSTVTSGSLFAALGGSPDAGGTWSPAFAGAGTYTYTVAATAPCTVDAVSTVSVTEQAQPDAGTNGTLTICSGSTVTSGSLFAALGGSPDAGGTWSPAFAGAGTYTYTVAATAPCTVDAVSTVSVTEQAQPDAGTNGTLTICSGSTVTSGSLFAALGGSPDAGGTWSPAFAGAGTYTYTVAATAPCTVDAVSTVSVTEQAQPDAGTNGTLTICSGSTVTSGSLFAALGGSPDAGGTWSPAFAGAGTYTYTVAATAPCTVDAVSTVSVTEQAQPDAGTNGTLTICSGSTVTSGSLFAALGGSPDAGGTWSPAFAGAGTYTYTVAATAPCTVDAVSTVSVTEQAQPNAGTNGTLTICSGSTVTSGSLFAALGGSPDAGGTWSPAFAGAGTYTYTVAATAPCTVDAVSTVSVTEQAQPDAGTNGTLTICSGSTVTSGSLFAALGGSPDAGGTWSPAFAGAGTYTYTVAATAPCTVDAVSTVSVTEQAQPDAGTNGTLTICSGSTVTSGSLFAALGGSPDAGGTWSPAFAGAGTYTYTVAATAPCTVDAVSTVSVTEQAQPDAGTNGTLTICSGSTVTSGSLFAALGGSPDAGGTWSPAFAGAGTYTYTVAATAPCTVDAVSTVSVTEQAQPDAGTNGTLTICSGSTVTAGSLFAALGGSPDAGGTWSPAFAGAGTYTYTVAATAPCTVDAVSTVSVTEQAQPDAGTNGTLTICSGSTVTSGSLFAALGGSPDAGGTWSPAFAGAGTYTYTVAATAPCTVDAVSTVSVTEQAQPNAGTNGTLTICSGSTVTSGSLFAALGGSPDAGGTWSPAFAGAGTYTYTVAATAPCTVDAVSTVSVTEQAQPDAGTNGTLTICSGSTVTSGSLFAALGGSPDAGGTWSPAFAGAGTYTYTVAATAPCTVDAVSTVSVTEQAQPDAGTNGTLTICSGSTVTSGSLFAALGGSPDAGGTWSPAFAGAGTYTYTVAATAPCTVDAVSTVSVTEQVVTVPNPILSQPTCTISTGSVLLTGLPSGNWTINPGNITGSGTSTTITGLVPGNIYSFTVTTETGCASLPSADIIVRNVICGNTETTASINGFTGGTTPALTSNDKLNGADVVIGTNPGEVKVTPVTVPTGLTLNADGTVTVAANTAAGNYDVTYKICEVTNPTNCDEVTSVIVVSQPTIDAVAETTASINGYTGGTTPALTSNDKLNGADVVIGTNPGEVKLTPVTVPTGLTLNADGTVTVAANTAAGNYDVTYKICEVTNPTNCDEVTSTIVVGKSIITALTETTDPINGRLGGTTYSLVNNDLLNGVAVVIRNSNGGVILTSVSVPSGLTLNADGTVKVDAGTPIGLYEVEYTICEFLNPTTNCATVKSYVLVTGSAPSAGVLKANDDNGGTIDTNKGEKPNVNVFKNDTYNGLPLDPSTVILTTVVSNPNLILKADGSIEVKDGTPVGDYELTYQICEVLSTDNCSQAKVKVSVENSVDPEPPVSEIVLGNDTAAADGINGSLEFINVLDNDFLNEKPINSLDIIITNISKSPYFEFNSDGTVNVKPNTPGGNYTIAYQVCEKADSSNCSTGMLNVFVEVPEIALVKTAVFNDENGNGVANAGETITYKFVVTNTGNVPLKGVMITDPLVGVKVFGQAIDLDVNESNDTNFTAEYKITQSDINHGSVSNQASVKGSSARGVVVEDISDDASLTDDKPTVLGLTGCVIKVFNAFSPNGDAKNSRFYIQGLECYPNNTVEIYNRWGVLVFDIDRYNNEDRVFTGFSQGRTTISETAGLPVGTYFYIIKYTDSDSNPHELSGYLYLNK